jgi:hypothetical protein
MNREKATTGRTGRRRMKQTELFGESAEGPDSAAWMDLPTDTRKTVIELVARLLSMPGHGPAPADLDAARRDVEVGRE